MNIVKGVADLIRRTSSGHTEESSGLQAKKFTPPVPKIRFSDAGDEAIVNSLWQRYEKIDDKVEKKRMFHVFLKQFLLVYKDWVPVNSGKIPEGASTTFQYADNSPSSDDVIVGCIAGHPAEVIRILIEEVTQLSFLVTELNTSMEQSSADLTGAATNFFIASEGLAILDALKIITRSLYNCRVFGYYGGIQKITAMMKAAVVQLKTISGTFSADESLSSFTMEKFKLLQQILLYVVSIICNFIDLGSNIDEKDEFLCSIVGFVSFADASISSSDGSSVLSSEERSYWHQKAIVCVMEAGGLNWLVEVLRIIRRLSMKDQWMDDSIQYLTLKILCLALSANPRGQNHFKSIGGLEVLLDGLGVPSNYMRIYGKSCGVDGLRDNKQLQKILQLHVLALEVLREAVFGNMNNLQFLCENGRVHKFATSFCSPAFMLIDMGQEKDLAGKQQFGMLDLDLHNKNFVKPDLALASGGISTRSSFSIIWNDYVVKLSSILCSFLLIPEGSKSHHVQIFAGRLALSISSVYCELSIKWVMRVLLTIFPCIKACSSHNKFPCHLRIFVTILQEAVLNAFKDVVSSSPMSLEFFREEGIWDLIFSENFFYFEVPSEENSGETFAYSERSEFFSASSSNSSISKEGRVNILQMEVISFLEFAATSNGNSHNLVRELLMEACNGLGVNDVPRQSN